MLALSGQQVPSWVPKDIVPSASTLRAFAGAPVFLPAGDVAGAICIISRQDITVSLAHLGALEVLAHLVGGAIARQRTQNEQSQRGVLPCQGHGPLAERDYLY
ncbi:MAG: hypothetical protein KatS3mg059_1653 [Thermomicrobiales bacterium]|nr:MAG: hypothetical protein KatS3mg059_1653 [Thermomicrobiales bacterium]